MTLTPTAIEARARPAVGQQQRLGAGVRAAGVDVVELDRAEA